MRKFILSILLQLVALLADKPSTAFERAKALVLLTNLQHPDVSGERKRSLVINTLISEFPTERHKDLALFIEQVIQEIK